MLIVFFVVPFSTMIAVSFFKRNPAGFYTPDFVFDNYARFLSLFFGSVLGFSLMLAVLVAHLLRRHRLSLHLSSDQACRAACRRSGWSACCRCCRCRKSSSALPGRRCFRAPPASPICSWLLGLMDKPVALLPTFGAVLTGMVYQALPYTILVLYPALVRARPDAARGRAHARRLAGPRLLQRRRAGAAQHASWRR